MFQNQLQVNARLLQQHIATTTGKLIPLKDIHNMRAHSAKVGTDEWEATLQELEKLQIEVDQISASVSVSAPNVDKWALSADVRFRPKAVIQHSVHFRFRRAAVGKFGDCRK